MNNGTWKRTGKFSNLCKSSTYLHFFKLIWYLGIIWMRCQLIFQEELGVQKIMILTFSAYCVLTLSPINLIVNFFDVPLLGMLLCEHQILENSLGILFMHRPNRWYRLNKVITRWKQTGHKLLWIISYMVWTNIFKTITSILFVYTL